MSTSAAYRLPGVAVLALLSAGGIWTAHHAERASHETSTTSLAAPRLTLMLLTHDSDVTIATGTGRRIRIVRKAHWVGTKPTHSVSVSPGPSARVDLRDHCPGGVGGAAALLAFHTACDVSYTVTVPAGQSIVLTVDSGDIRLRNLRGKLVALDGSGDIDATGMRTWDTNLTSQSGDVSASFTRAPTSLQAASSSGDVSLHVPGGRYAIRATANSGDRSVDPGLVGPKSGRTIEASSASGDVSIGASNG